MSFFLSVPRLGLVAPRFVESSIVFDLGLGPLNQEPLHIEVLAQAKRQVELLSHLAVWSR
jgi:hypothetical protein